MNFHKNQAKIEQKRLDTHVLEMDANYCTLASFSLSGVQSVQNDLAWCYLPSILVFMRFPQDIAPLIMSSVVYSAELDETSPTNKEGDSSVFTFEKKCASSHFAGFDGSWSDCLRATK